MADAADTDIILGACSGQAWLVRGEQHIDDLLANTLPAHVSIVILPCESKSEVDALWYANGGGTEHNSELWLIHPAVVNRVRGVIDALCAVFDPWSASLNPAALDAVQAAAEAAEARDGSVVALVRHVAADAPPMAADLANLRSGLLEAQLASHGIGADRIVRDTRPADQPGDTERIDLLIRDA